MKKVSILSVLIYFLIICLFFKIAQEKYQDYVENMKKNTTNSSSTEIDFTKNNSYTIDADFTEENNTKNKTVQNIKIKNYPTNQNIINVKVNKPTPLSYKTKKEIYNLRKKFVRESIFDIPNYEPSNEVYGGIEDKKPWISTKSCRYKEPRIGDIEGPSEESRFINNPTILVALEYPFWGYDCDEMKEGKSNDQELPHTVSYDKEKNEITVIYNSFRYCNLTENRWHTFNGLNARDLGYRYIYVDKEKSNFSFPFKEDINVTNSVIEFQDLLHVGGACLHENGCNNGSPKQPPLNFRNPCYGKNYTPNRVMYIKLWREKPASPKDKADIVQKIIIEKVWE